MTVLEAERISKADENREEAKLVARDIIRHWHDPEYRMAFIMGLGELLGNILEHHDAEIRVMVRKAVEAHLNTTRRAIVKSYIRTTLKDEIAKADGDWTQAQRMRQQRRSHGRYISYDSPFRHISVGPPQYQGFGAVGHEAEQAAELHQAFARRVGSDRQQAVRYHIIDPNGNISVTAPMKSTPTLEDGYKIIGGQGAGYEEPHTIGESLFNVTQAMGLNPQRAGAATGVVDHFNNLVNQTDWGNRATYMSTALGHATGGGKSVDVASEMFKLVGKHGPGATTALQPHMRRALYRYRGVEAEPQQMSTVARNGKHKDENLDSYHRRLALDLAKKLPSRREIELMIQSGQMPPSRGYLLNRNGRVVSEAAGEHDDHYLPFNLKNLGALNGGSYVRSRAYGGPSVEDIHVGLATGTNKQTIVSRNGIFEIEYAHRVQRGTEMEPTTRIGRLGEQLRKPKGGPKSRLTYRELTGTYRDHGFGDPTKVMTKRYARLLDAIAAGKITDPDSEAVVVKPEDIPVTDLPRHVRMETQAGNGNWVIRSSHRDEANRLRREYAEKRSGRRMLQLDGHGYEVALKSLQQQYPYFINKVDYKPATRYRSMLNAGVAERDGNTAAKDKGYVRPYHLKPAGVKSDWHDERLRPSGSTGVQTFDEVEGFAWGPARDAWKRRRGGGEAEGGSGGTPAAPRGGGGGGSAPPAADDRGGAGPRQVNLGDQKAQTQHESGGGSQNIRRTDEEALHSQVTARITHWLSDYAPMLKKPPEGSDDELNYDRIQLLKDRPKFKQQIQTPGISEEKLKTAKRLEAQADDLVDQLREDPGLVEELDTYLRVATGQRGLPMPVISASPFSETKTSNQRVADEDLAAHRSAQVDVPLKQWRRTPQGMKFTQAMRNHDYLRFRDRVIKAGGDVDAAFGGNQSERDRYLDLETKMNRLPDPASPIASFYLDETGAPITPNAFWNSPTTNAEGQDTTTFHEYTHRTDEDGQTDADKHRVEYVAAYAKERNREPDPINLRMRRVIDNHGADLIQEAPVTPRVTAEQSAADISTKFSQAAEEAKNLGRISNMDEIKQEEEAQLGDAADKWAAAAGDVESDAEWDRTLRELGYNPRDL